MSVQWIYRFSILMLLQFVGIFPSHSYAVERDQITTIMLVNSTNPDTPNNSIVVQPNESDENGEPSLYGNSGNGTFYPPAPPITTEDILHLIYNGNGNKGEIHTFQYKYNTCIVRKSDPSKIVIFHNIEDFRYYQTHQNEFILISCPPQ